ncbi:hypothetical protein J6590_082167, partial [Homalodisca vitripennis]
KIVAAMKPRCEDVSAAHSIADLGSELKEVRSLMEPSTPTHKQPRIEIMKK